MNATVPSPLRATLNRARHGKTALVLALIGGVAQHAGAVVASTSGAWLIATAVTGAEPGALSPGLIVLAVAVVVAGTGTWAAAQFGHAFAFRYQAGLRLALYDGLERSAPRELQGRRTGEVAAGVGMLLTSVVPVIVARRTERDGHRLREEIGGLNGDVVDGVQGIRELLAFRQVGAWQAKLTERTSAIRRHQLAHGRAVGFQNGVTDLLSSVTTITVLITAVVLSTSGGISLVTATVAVGLVIAAVRPVTEVVEMAGQLAPLRASARRVVELIDQPAQVPDNAGGSPRADSPAVRFDHVSFSYEPGRPVLEDVTFEVPAGSTVAIVGPSGAGKSTCVNLLLRFWDVERGAITLGGHDLRDFPLAGLREHVTVIPQDVYLFDDTIAGNLRLGRPDATLAELEAAARAANAHDFIEALPEGYDTKAGERGLRLSGGQRQRLAIARALVSPASVLVMDEAASNLDTENERDIQAALRNLRHGHTTIIIAHRLSTIRGADRIVVLDAGRVAETGSHDDLLARGGPYARLIAAQRDGVIPDLQPS